MYRHSVPVVRYRHSIISLRPAKPIIEHSVIAQIWESSRFHPWRQYYRFRFKEKLKEPGIKRLICVPQKYRRTILVATFFLGWNVIISISLGSTESGFSCKLFRCSVVCVVVVPFSNKSRATSL